MKHGAWLTIIILCGLLFSVSAQETGSLIIESDSDYVEIKLNGEETGLFTPYNEELEAGEYAVELVFSPFLRFRDTVLITAGQVTRISENNPQKNGNLLINSTPTGASVYMNKQLLGETPLALKEISPGDYIFNFKKDKYNDATVSVNVTAADLTKAFAELTAGYGTVSILANPEADIYIDDKFEGKRMYNGRLSTGTHVIEVKKESYDSQKKLILVEEGKAYREMFQLEPVFGKLSINSNPTLAHVYFDGEMIGFSSMILDSVSVGTHVLRLEKDGYILVEKEVKVEKNQTTYIGEDLKSGLVVISMPEKAKIYLDDEYKGTSPQIITGIAPGNYTLKAELEGFPVLEKEVQYKKNTADSVLIKFEQGFMITSNPSDAKIYIDGALAGNTPMLFKGMEGEHEIVLKKDGFAEIVAGINFNEAEGLNFNYELSEGYRVEITTNSDDAEIWVDGELVDTASTTIPLTGGEHKISFKNSTYFNDYEETVNIAEDGQLIDIALNPKMCTVKVISKPKDGTVTLNSALSFDTDVSTIVKGGLYQLKLESKGFKPLEDEVIIDKANQKFEYLMEPVRYRSKGTAVFLNMFWPGAGRSYLTRGETAALGGFLFYGLGAGAYFTNQKAIDLRDEAGTLGASEYTERDRLIEQAEGNELYSSVMLYSAIGVWGISMISTLATPSERKRYEKLKVITYYNPNNKSSNIGLVYNF